MSPRKPDITNKKPPARAARASVPLQGGEKWDSKSEETEKLRTMLSSGMIPRHVTLSQVVKDYLPEYSRFKYCSLRNFIQKVCDTMHLQEGMYFCYDGTTYYILNNLLCIYMIKMMKRGRKRQTIIIQCVILQRCLLLMMTMT